MRVKRASAVATMVLLLSGISLGPADARPPARSCPPPFDGPLTFEQVLVKYPPPPGFPDPISLLARFDRNGDRNVCVLDIPGDPINVVDNVAR
jgi:hypothetical protein